MATYFKMVRVNVEAGKYEYGRPHSDVDVVDVPGTRFGVIVKSPYRGVIVKEGDFIVRKKMKSSVMCAERFLSQFKEDDGTVLKLIKNNPFYNLEPIDDSARFDHV